MVVMLLASLPGSTFPGSIQHSMEEILMEAISENQTADSMPARQCGPDPPRRPPRNDIDAPSMSFEQHECSIDVVSAGRPPRPPALRRGTRPRRSGQMVLIRPYLAAHYGVCC